MLEKLVTSVIVDDILGNFLVSVPPGHIACLYDRGRGVLRKVLKPGLHLKIPFWQKAKLFNTQIQEYPVKKGFNAKNEQAIGDKDIIALTVDDRPVSLEGTILFRINAEDASSLWENIGDDFVKKIIRPITRSRIRMVISNYTNMEIYTKQDEIELSIERELKPVFETKSLVLEDVLLSNISPANEEELKASSLS
ncbi:MAG TPA: prohibitin family protein [bacterium]|nr:prohibitin family protein [bacterium]